MKAYFHNMFTIDLWQLLCQKMKMDYYRFSSHNFVQFGIIWVCHQKWQCWTFFPLSFYHWVGIFCQKWLLVKNVEFENSSWYWPSKKVVNFQILHFWLKVILDQKFQLSDENWVGKVPNIVIFGDRTQIILNWAKLHEKNRI